MHLSKLISEFTSFFTLPRDNPNLVTAKYAALSKLIPLLYVILLANSWVLAIDFSHAAPTYLTLYFPLLATLFCGVRLAVWARRQKIEVPPNRAVYMLFRTNALAALLALGLSAWAIALYPYGDPFAQSHVAFYMAITIIGCAFCLMHLRSAALIVTAVGCTAFIGFFVSTGNVTFIGMAVNVTLISISMLAVLVYQNRDFYRLVVAQADALALIAENAKREREQYRLLRMIDDMPVAVMTVDPITFEITYFNETSKRTLSQIEGLIPIKANELLGQSIDIFHKHPEHQRRLLSSPENLPHRARINLGPEVLDLQVTAVNATDGSYLGPMLTWSIVTQQVQAEKRILQFAHYDTLTGLANRTTFRDTLHNALERRGKETGLLFIDLDGFKMINSKGHLVGDILLKQVADRLLKECGGPRMTVGRLGGDEFAILIEDGDADQTAIIAERLVEALVAPYYLDNDRQLQIGASIGVALAPVHGDDPDTMLSRADIALYAAKAAGKRTYRMFAPEMETRIQERVRLEADLRVALEEDKGLFVFYQPIVDIQTKRVTAREALMRFYHPRRGWVSPVDFIPVAEESGLIDQLGSFVLRRACRDATEWTDGARVAVNVSPGQLGKGTLATSVVAALGRSGLSVSRLELEVTESALLNRELDCTGELRAIHELGVRVALDDFGTGYSSLAHLRAFPFDKIKIDGSFVRDAVKRPDCAAVVKAVADLGKRLGVTTVAEGVETEELFERVAEEGCTEVQGYLFGRPAPHARDLPAIEEINRSLFKVHAA